MRTPNTECILCRKPLYRRPTDMAKSRYAACIACRGKAQSVSGVTPKQAAALMLGRPKGTNHRLGYSHRAESKGKAAVANRTYWAANRDAAIARAAAIRGDLHYRWNGGASRLNISIRQMTENRRWIDAVKARDGACVRCGSTERLESHHKDDLANLIAKLGIKSRADARRHGAALWDTSNGETLCVPCHDRLHGRKLRSEGRC